MEEQIAYADQTPYEFVANEWPMFNEMDHSRYHYVISLREAQSRYYSHARMVQQDNHFDNWMATQPDNYNLRMICGTRCLYRPKYQLTREDLVFSLERLKEFDSILLLEFFNYTYGIFASKVGWKMYAGRKTEGSLSGSSKQLPPMESYMHVLDDITYGLAKAIVYREDTTNVTDHLARHESTLTDYFDNAPKTFTMPCGTSRCKFIGAWGHYMNNLLMQP